MKNRDHIFLILREQGLPEPDKVNGINILYDSSDKNSLVILDLLKSSLQEKYPIVRALDLFCDAVEAPKNLKEIEDSVDGIWSIVISLYLSDVVYEVMKRANGMKFIYYKENSYV